VDLSNPNPLSFYHVPFQPFPPAKAMAGPIIELGQITAKDEQGVPDEMSKVVAGIFSAANNHPKCLGSAKGICVEDKSKLVIALAWESVEVSPSSIHHIISDKFGLRRIWRTSGARRSMGKLPNRWDNTSRRPASSMFRLTRHREVAKSFSGQIQEAYRMQCEVSKR
jgi:hypothetical protein